MRFCHSGVGSLQDRKQPLFCLCTHVLLLAAGHWSMHPVNWRHPRPPPYTRQTSQALPQGSSYNGVGWNDRDESTTVCCSPKAAFVCGDDEPATRPWSDALADSWLSEALPAYAEACIDITCSPYRYASRYICPLVCGCDSWAHPTLPRTSSHIGEGLRSSAANLELNLTSIKRRYTTRQPELPRLLWSVQHD